MADFSQLPNEMVSQIWGYILEPEDVESFALVSKHIYATGRSCVEEHNKLKREYSFFRFDSCTAPCAQAYWLKEVLLRPRFALYVTHISIGRYLSEWQDSGDDHDDDNGDEEWPDDGHTPYPGNVMALFIEAIGKPSLVPLNEVSRWTTRIRAGDEDPVLALLSMLLPNLTTITLLDEGCNGELFKETIQRIAEAEKMMFFTRLVTVNIVFTSNGNYMDLDLLRKFAALPLLQSMHLNQMGTNEAEVFIDYTQYFKPGNYNITELTFTNSGVRPKFLFQFLESIKGLKKFSYVNPDETFCQFEPFWIRVALLANAKHTLESLKILSPLTHEHELLGSLREFTTLKELETNIRLLGHWDEFDKLADLLPTSLETIDLDTRENETCNILPRLVEEIVKGKLQHVSRLKTLKLRTEPEVGTMQGGRSLVEPLKELCRNVGIELTFVAT